MKNRKIDELVFMELEEDEIQACLELIEKMKEEKRLAAKREKAKTKLTEAVYDMVKLTDIATVRHFLMDLLRIIPS